ncbi:RT0821/Lpp0805 family surface protein [Xaviernesmea oryzae]|nr:RT0821/Lpp0805 family surface protein [Xaviernesmea oryzae]SEK67268.1 outer membrane surface antigen [Xaviernesmea oryzae]
MGFLLLRLSVMLGMSLALTGCFGTGADLARSVDTSLSTGAIPPKVASADMADAVTVKDVVTQANPSVNPETPIPWANSASGSAGVIERVEERREGTRVCRSFTTTRHSYQGIAKFDGDTCLDGNGIWIVRSFAARS